MPRIRDYMRGSPDELERIQERTRQGHYKLDGGEARWRDKAELLLQHGYRLRPRLIPGWTPSWEGTDLLPQYCEDSVRALSVTAMDAIRVLDGKRVMIKKTRPQTTKATVVHILEIFPDTSTVESNVVFIVMPLLREFYDPPFDTVREGVDFMRQTLTGITFMHKSGVAHLECTAHNIMMDASQMYPNCFHPTRKSRNFDGISTAKCISRTKAKSVKYFFTDFEKSRVITSEGDRRMRRRQGARNLPPEIERGELYDPFPVDMYYLGNTNREHLLEKYTNMEFLRPLVVSLIQDDPKARPSAPEALAQFENIISSCKGCSLRRKGRRCDEGRWSKAIGDVWSVGQEVLPTAPKTARPLTIVLRSTIGTLRKRQPFVLPGN